MPYCHVCGAKIPDDAIFCPNCGAKVAATSGATGSGAASTPSEDMREAFGRMSLEIEKAFNIAAKEVQTAFETARSNIQKNMYPTVCPNCGEKNPSSAEYCFNCGKKLTKPSPEQNKESKTSTS